MTRPRPLVAAMLGLALLLSCVVVWQTPAVAAATGITSTLVNFDGSGTAPANQVARFDTDGNAVDAEEGQISQVTDPSTGTITFVLIGESHNCGFIWPTPPSPWCGFNAYTSSDLIHWRYRGKLFDPDGTMGAAGTASPDTPSTTWQSVCNGNSVGCFRPHTIYNSVAGTFVLWFYSSRTLHYYVMTSKLPYLGFVLTKDDPMRPPAGNTGDEGLFVDPTSTDSPPRAYIAFYDNAPTTGTDTIDIQQLNTSYDGVVGTPTRTYATSTNPAGSGVEAPSMFERTVGAKPVYFVTFSDPHCGYGTSCGVSYMWSLSPAGPWGPGPVNTTTGALAPKQPEDGSVVLQPGTQLNATSCGGQPTAVSTYTQQDGTTGYLFQSNLNTALGTNNQGLANFYWAPLSFDSAGSPQPFACSASAGVSLEYGAPGADSNPPYVDQSSAAGTFQHSACTQGGAAGQTAVVQSFSPSTSGMLGSLRVTVFQKGIVSNGQARLPNMPLHISVVPMSGTGSAARPSGAAALADTTLSSTTFATGNPASNSVGWSMRTVAWDPGTEVYAGQSYGIELSSATTIGCYGFAMSDPALPNPYPSGALLTPSNGSWVPASGNGSGQALRFTASVLPPGADLALGAPVTVRSVTGFASWAPGNLTDGVETSTAASNGYHSTNTNTDPEQPEWAVVDLGVDQVIGQVSLFPAHPAGYLAGFGFPVRFRIDVSNTADFGSYTTVVDRTAADYPNPGDARQDFATLAVGRYVRIYVTQLPKIYSDIYAFALAEMEVRAAVGPGAVVDDTSPQISYGGAMLAHVGLDPQTWFAGSAHSLWSAGASATYSCSSCGRLVWLGTTGNDRGVGTVTVDGREVATVDTYARTVVGTHVLYDSGPLAPGAHTIVVTVSGTANPSSGFTWVEVDAFVAG